MAKNGPNPGQYQKVADLLKQINAESRALGLSEQARIKIEDEILSRRIKSGQALQTEINNAIKLDAQQRKIAATEQKRLDNKEKFKEVEKEILDLSKQALKPLSMLGSLNKKAEGSRKLQKTLAIEDLKTKIDQVKVQKELGNLTTSEAKKLTAGLKQQKKTIQALSTIEKKSPALATGLQAAAEAADGLQDSVDGFFNALPGGDYIKNALGLDKLGAVVQEGLVASIGAIGPALAAGQSPLMALKAGMMAFNKVVMMNPMVLVGAAIAAAAVGLVALVGLAGDHEEKARGLAEEMGVSVQQGKAMLKNAQSAASAFGTQLVNAEDVLAVQKEINAELGNAGMISAEVAAEVADIGNSFGYGAAEAGKLQATFQSMGVTSAEAADMQRDLAAESLKAGVNVGAVVADIAQNAADTSKYFGGNVKALKKAAIEANKLGMSISDMADVSDSLLDFESSIAAQFEFQALSGKQINLDLARQKALQGDIAGATQEVLSQVGSIHDFNQMDVLEREALAKATGLSVDQLQKSLAIQEALPGATQEQLAAVNELGLSAAEIQDMSSEELQQRLAQAQAQQNLNKQMQNMKAELSKALLPLAEAFMGVFSMLSPVLQVISGIFKGIGAFIQGFLAPIQFVFNVFQKIRDTAREFLDTIGFLDPVVATLSFAFDAIKNTLMIAGGILGTVFLPNIIAAGVAAVTSAAGYIASAIGAIFTGFGMIPFGIGVPLAFAAVAGLIATAASYMNDGVISGKSGSSGYGDRVLFGPEGAISFNNKDTIVAGTNLFGDDVISGPGKIRLADDYASDMPDPPETKVVGLSGNAIGMLSMGIAAAIGTGVAPAFVAALGLAMPVIGATITGAIIAGNAATALIPKPVLVLNPVLPVFETNPIMMMGAMIGGIGSVIGGIFGGGKKSDPNAEIVAKLDEVVMAIQNMNIEMDGGKVGVITRLRDTFRRG